MSSEDLEALRRGYEAFSAGDLDAVVTLIDPDIEVEIAHVWTLREGKAVRRCAIVALLGLTLIVPVGCGGDSASRKGPQRLSAAENSTVRRAQVSVHTYCAKLALYLDGRRDAPAGSETQRVNNDLDELIALAKRKPEGLSVTEETTRQVLGDMAEDLQGSNCSGNFAQKLDRALGELPPEQ